MRFHPPYRRGGNATKKKPKFLAKKSVLLVSKHFLLPQVDDTVWAPQTFTLALALSTPWSCPDRQKTNIETWRLCYPFIFLAYLILQLKCQDPSHNAGTEFYNLTFHSYLNYLHSQIAVFSSVKIHLHIFVEKWNTLLIFQMRSKETSKKAQAR